MWDGNVGRQGGIGEDTDRIVASGRKTQQPPAGGQGAGKRGYVTLALRKEEADLLGHANIICVPPL